MTSDLDSKQLAQAIGIVILVVGGLIGVSIWLLAEHFAAKPIAVQVELENRCQMPDDVFMVKVMPDGTPKAFNGKKARLTAMSDDRIQLIANTRFKDFRFEGAQAKAKANVTLIAICEHKNFFGNP